MNLDERVIRKRVVRKGRWVIVKKTDRKGYKIKDGKEVRMTPSEIRNRRRSARRAARKRKSKTSSMIRKRLRSMNKY